jgi:hypothetical protein
MAMIAPIYASDADPCLPETDQKGAGQDAILCAMKRWGYSSNAARKSVTDHSHERLLTVAGTSTLAT